MKKQFEEFGYLGGNPNIEIIEYKNKFYCLSGWNGEEYLDCWEYANGVWLGVFKQFNGKKVTAYSDDEIEIYNVKLPLSKNSLYDCELNINEYK